MKKILFSIVVSIMFLACNAQVTITRVDGSTLEGTGLKMKKGMIDYGTGTIALDDVLFMKYRNKYLCQEGKKRLGMLKKNFNPDINDKNSMALVMAHKFYKCKCNPASLSAIYQKYETDEAFISTYNTEQQRIKTGRVLGVAGGVLSGIAIFIVVNVLVASAI